MILVTGATGQLGARVIEHLLARVPADQLAVSVRAPEKASALRARGVDVRRGDFDDPTTLETAFSGVDKLLLISTDGDNATRIRRHLAAVGAAKAAGLAFIAYTSIVKADENSLSLAEVHRSTEQAIRQSRIPYCFLRNNWYLENEMAAIRAAHAGAPVITAVGQARIGWALRDDYAQAAASVLAGEGHHNSIYDLSGAPKTYDDLAAGLSDVLKREVSTKHVDDAGFASALSDAGVDAGIVRFLLNIQQPIREGALDVSSDDLARLLGRPPTPLPDALAITISDLDGTSGS